MRLVRHAVESVQMEIGKTALVERFTYYCQRQIFDELAWRDRKIVAVLARVYTSLMVVGQWRKEA